MRFRDRRVVQLGRRFDVHHCHAAVSTDEQQIGNMASDSTFRRPDQLKRLRRDRDHLTVMISQHDPSQLQAALIDHQPLNRRRPVPTRVMASALVPTELPHGQPTGELVHHHAIQCGVHELAVHPAIPHPDTAGSVLKTEGHNGDAVSDAVASPDATLDRFSSI
ncbi:MAG TPA: hypothetical protein VFC00_19465 [Micromonosporaceae bacterium]|nr:hypothetical protein [Micromonosporaceae bacterium]